MLNSIPKTAAAAPFAENMADNQSLLLIFTRNPEPGKCKTRLAATVGDRAALQIYLHLLEHTADITRNLEVVKTVYYSEDIWANDLWDNTVYHKKLQQGDDLGARMKNAFREGFALGYRKIVVIGSDLYDLSEEDLKTAFEMLTSHDFVLGPAKDGGYYLLGMKEPFPELFHGIAWGTATVLADSISRLSNKKVALLDVRNDVDVYDDISGVTVFSDYIKHVKNNAQ